MRVAVIGQGYVGLTIAISAGQAGHKVIGLDVNPLLILALASGTSHIEGIESCDVAQLISGSTYVPTTDETLLSQCDVIVIAVPTPLTDDRLPDLAYVHAASDCIARVVTKPTLVINESTSFPGTLRNEIASRIFKASGVEHLYAASPERVDPGNEKWVARNTPRLIGGLTAGACAAARSFYASFCDTIIEVSSPEVAEAAKLFENTFRQVNIALVNEFAQVSHALGIPVREVLDAAATKPYGFMKFLPGAGVGGHCIPVDPSYLAYVAEKASTPATFIARANAVNLAMPTYVAKRVIAGLAGTVVKKKIVVVGVSYKANVADTRETPAAAVIDLLREAGADVSWHDPLVGSWRGEQSRGLTGFDAAVVVTLHDQINVADVQKSGYIFDCTGLISGADGL
ncbi:MAG: nucleotide sugar dehydrogenase [Methylophilaceae bacterium]|nr:MAG: nucleotide sugar dehydrogenase [Methylophilaceae bacterium]